MDATQHLCLELLEGVANIEQQQPSLAGNENHLEAYLLRGRGGKILNYLLELAKQGIACPPEIVHLAASLIQILTTFQPSDSKSTSSLSSCWYKQHLSHDIRKSGKNESNWVKLHNNLIKKRKKKYRKGKKISWRKRRNRFDRFAILRSRVRTSSSSSNETIDNGAIPRVVQESEKSRRLSRFPCTGSIKTEEKDRLGKTKMFRTSSDEAFFEEKVSTKGEKQKTDIPDVENMGAFEGPFHLATVLMELLETSFCSHHSYSPANGPSDPVDGDSPMSVAIQLVTAITALHQTKTSFVRTNSEDNDKSLSNISFEDSRWTLESVSHLQRLVLRTAIVLCHVGLERGEDITELVHCQAIESVLQVSHEILRRGGMIPHGSLTHPKLRSSIIQTDSHESTLSDQSAKDAAQIDASKRLSVPAVTIDLAGVEPQPDSGNYQEKFERKFVRVKKQILLNAESALPGHILFVSEVITGIFGLLTRVLQNTPATLSHKQLSEVCSLLHEFYNRNGFTVFSTLLQTIGAFSDDMKNQNTSTKRSMSTPASSPGKSAGVTSSTATFGARNATCNQLFISLLSSYERLINTIQKLKIEYLHKVGCSRHSHKSCDLSKLVPVHHSLLGENFKQASFDKSSDLTQSVPPNTTSKKISDHLQKLSLTAFREDSLLCVVATSIKFFISLTTCLRSKSIFLRETLRFLDRVGMCECVHIASIVVPLLCNLSKWSEKTQNIALSIVGKMLLHHYHDDTDDTSSNDASVPSMHITDVPSTWVEVSLPEATDQESDKASPSSWRHSMPVDIKMSSASHQSNVHPAEEIMLQHRDFPWLCLCLYKPLLHCQNIDLALKVALNLQSLSQHLCKPAKNALLTLVLIPIIHDHASCHWEALSDPSNSTKQHCFVDDVIFIVLGIILQFLEECNDCKVLFIRHGGMKVLNKLLDQIAGSEITNIGVLPLLLDMERLLSTKTLLNLSHASSVNIVKPISSCAIEKQLQTEPSTSTQTGSVRSFFRVISLTWGNEKRRLKDVRDRASSLDSKVGKNLKANLLPSSVQVDEYSVYLIEMKKFIQTALGLTGAMSHDLTKDKLRKTLSFVRAVSGADSTDSDTEASLTGKKKRKLSETSGYRSTSLEHLDPSADKASNQSIGSSIIFTTDSIQLPGETDSSKWKKLSDFWDIIGFAVPTGGELCSIFLDMNGFYIALKLLNLISMGLSSYFDSEIEFTHPTIEQSFNESFQKSTSVHSSTERLTNLEKTEENKTPIRQPSRLNSMPKISFSNPDQKSNLKKSVSLDDLLSEAFSINIFKSPPPVDSAINTPESAVDMELQQRVLELQLHLFTSCLRICLFCAKRKHQFDLDVDDIMSMLKPTFRARVSSITFCRLLHSSLFRAAVKPAEEESMQEQRLKTVLNGLQRTINSGGSISRGHSRSNSASLLLSPSLVRQLDVGRLNEKFDSSCPTSPGHPTHATESHYATKDDEEETMSDSLSSEGYEGDSETDSHTSTALSSSIHATPYKVRLNDIKEDYENHLKFSNGPLTHPELLLLSIELLGVKKQEEMTQFSDDKDQGITGYSMSHCALATRDNVALSVIRGLMQVAAHSSDNRNKLAKRYDVVSACLTHFADYLQTTQQSYNEHREQLLTLCKNLNKHHMTPKHVRLFFSLFNCCQPPLEPLLLHLLDLVDHQKFGPLWHLPFSWTSPGLLEGSTSSDSDSEIEETLPQTRDVPPQRSLSVWRMAPFQMPLENRIAWPPLGSGVTVSLWLKVDLESAGLDATKSKPNWGDGHTVAVDPGSKAPMQGSPYIHFLSLGSRQTMLQVWMESTTLIFRICIDPNDDKPVGLLAQAECANFLPPNEWHHLTLTYTEDRMPDKAILGKVHLVLNCFLENDIILEFNVPQPAPKSGLSWRQSPSIAVGLQKTTFFLGHSEGITGDKSELSTTLPPGVSVGNVLLFNQPHPTCQSAFIIHQMGPDAASLTPCLVDSNYKLDSVKEYRVRFSTGASSTAVNVEVPPRLFQYLPQALSSDAVPDDVLLGEVEASPQHLQESLVMTFHPAYPKIYHVYTSNPGATPTRRKMLFRRVPADPSLVPSEFDPIIHTGYPLKTHRPNHTKVKPISSAGLNKSLDKVGGISVVLLLYPKVVELTIEMTSYEAELYQFLALKSLLNLRRTSAVRGKEFAATGVPDMLHKVMTKKECIIGYSTLQILFNMSCTEEVIQEYGRDDRDRIYEVNQENSAILYDYELLQTFLLDWKIWYKGKNQHGEQDFGVWILLLQGLESLTRDDHPHQWFNIKVLLKAGTVQRLLEGIQEMLSDGISPLPGADVTLLMVELIRGLMGSPPEMELLKTLCNFVISAHPPTGTFVCHSVTNFYFSLENPNIPRSNIRKSLENVKYEKSPSNATSPTTPKLIEPPRSMFSGSRKVTYERTLSLPVDPNVPKSFSSQLIGGDSSDSSSDADFHVEELPQTVVENGLLSPAALDPVPSKDRSFSERPQLLTPIKENVARSPRPRSLDNLTGEEFHGREGCIMEISEADGPVLFTMEGANLGQGAQSFLSGTTSSGSWVNISRNDEEIFTHSYGVEGVTRLMAESLNILFVAVMTMRDVDIPALFGDYLNPDMIVVFANHESPLVRTAAVRMLAVFFNRCSTEDQTKFLKKKGFQLVANQLHQHVTTPEIAEACFYLLLGHAIVIDEPLPLEGARSLPLAHDSFTNHAAVLLLAILEKSFWNGVGLCYQLLKRSVELFENVGPIADIMLDNGLALALCNLLAAISCDVTKKLDDSDKQLLYDAVEEFLGTIAVKACVTSGSGHFQIFEDMISLLQTVERKAVKFGRRTSEQIESVKAIASNILLKVMDAMKLSSGTKTCGLTKRKVSQDIPIISANHAPSEARPDSLKLSPEISIISSVIADSISPTLSDSSDRGSVSTRPVLKHQRSRSTGGGSDVFHLPSPTLFSNRSFRRSQALGSVAGDSIASSTFRPRASVVRVRPFRGSQRRRMNEGESASRLQRIVGIAVDRVVFTEKKHESTSCTSKLLVFPSVFSSSPPQSPLSTANGFGDGIGLPTSNDYEPSFSQTVFDLLISWLTQLVETTESQRKRLSTTQIPSLSWERILHISQSTLVEQTSRLLVHLLSPWQVCLQRRTFPLNIVSLSKIDNLLAILLPSSSAYGQKAVLCVHYLLNSYKHQLSKQEKHDGKKLLKILGKLGHRVPAQHRRATLVEVNGEGDMPHSPGVIEDFQDTFTKERRQAKSDWNKINLTLYQQLVKRTSALAEHVSRHAMEMTQYVVLLQNKQRKLLIGRIKDLVAQDLTIRKKWTQLLEQLAHERAVWYNPEQYPKSWQLDPTEGPFRERRRLQRCHIGIDRRFLLKSSTSLDRSCQEKGKPVSLEDDERSTPFIRSCVTHKRPLAFLFEDDPHSSDSLAIRTRLQTNERIRIIQSCTNVTAACETPGEILIGEHNMYFVGDQPIVDPSLTQAIFGEREIMALTWETRDVIEYHKRWWQLRDIAIEIFLSNGSTYLLAFKNIAERDSFYDELLKLELPNLVICEGFQSLTKSWCAGKLSNFDYLTKLNKTAGRSFNDLMQYPVMPFVMSDYTSQVLDLEASTTYRILGKPISVQDPSREQHFKDRYRFLEEDYKNCTEDEREMKTPPFHYGSHYSNSGTVLHFLVRLPPFTQLFLEYQDASFDIPDRTFHSMATTFKLSSYASTTDVKELIPEFFFLPEFLCNLEGFDFGLRQCGIRVHHVTLPPWCKEDPRLFVLIHRQALESDYVTQHLHEWIDLVFGFKQTGQPALDAVNVFHPATYFGMDVSSVDDAVKRKALETMVKTYGQTPKMLFNNPHPSRVGGDETIVRADGGGTSKTTSGGIGEMLPTSILDSLRGAADNRSFRRNKNSKVPRPIPSVKGIKWGNYVGSPSAPEPTIFLHKPVSGPIGALAPLQTNDVCALAPKMSLLVMYTRDKQSTNSSKPVDISWSALLTYDKPDNIVRLKLKHNSPGINLARFGPDSCISCCVATPDCRSIILGSQAGIIFVQKSNPTPEKGWDMELLPVGSLYCHTAAVTCLAVCGAYRIFASGSADGTATIWDLDSLSYIRSLTGHSGPVTSLAVSQTSGDVCTVCDSGNDAGSHIRLWTINGSLAAAQNCKIRVRCVAFSNAPEGLAVNVVAGGLDNGTVRLWSGWNLIPVRDIKAPGLNQPITSVTFTHNSMVLYAATEGNLLYGWCRKDKEKDKQPLLITFVDSKSAPHT